MPRRAAEVPSAIAALPSDYLDDVECASEVPMCGGTTLDTVRGRRVAAPREVHRVT